VLLGALGLAVTSLRRAQRSREQRSAL